MTFYLQADWIYNAMPAKATIHSVIGKDSHTPVIFNIKDRKNAIGIITKNPLDKETICAGRTFSVDVKYEDRIMLPPQME